MGVGIGVELAPGAVRAVILDSAGSAPKLVATQEAVCETANAEALSAALAQIRRTLHLSAPVILGVPGTSAILATVTPLVVNPRRSHLAVQFELQQQLPFELSDAAWHYRWLQNGSRLKTQGSTSSRLQPSAFSLQRNAAVVAAVRRSLLEERLASCRRAGLAVQAVAVNPVAMVNALRFGPRGGHTSSRVILHRLDEQTAEWIVWTPDRLQVVPVASPSPEVFWSDLTASWEALRAQRSEPLPPVTVIGASAPVAQEILGRLGLQGEPFDVTTVVKPGGLRLEHPERWTTACGLALQGAGLAGVPLNLLTQVQQSTQVDRIRRLAFGAGAICALAAVGFGVRGMLEVRGQRARMLEALERHEQLYQTLRPEVRALIQQQEEVEQRSLQLERLARHSTLLAEVLAKVAQALPDEAWLTAATCTKSGALLEGTFEGRATSFQYVTALFERLKQVAGMTTVKPLSTSVVTDSDTGKEAIAFSVQVQRPLEMVQQPATRDKQPLQPGNPSTSLGAGKPQ